MGVSCYQAVVPGFIVMEKIAGGGETDGHEMSSSHCPWIHGDGKGSWWW